MKMEPWKTQQMSPTFLFTISNFPWKLLLVMHNSSMEITKDTTEAFITWLDKAFLIVVIIKTNGNVQKINQQNSMDAKSTLNWIIIHLTLHSMVEIPSSMNSEPLDVIYNPSPNILKF